MARSFSQEARSDSHKIGETRYRMSHLPSTTAIARTLLLAGILLAVTVLAARSFFPAFAQETVNMNVRPEDPIDFDENNDDSVAVYTATDPEGEDIVWSLMDADVIVGDRTLNESDYPDHGDFSIDGGVLTFKDGPPDYEAPKGGAQNNSSPYKVMVVAKAGSGDAVTMTYIPVVVTIVDLEEEGSVTFNVVQPKQGILITATHTDPDEGIEDLEWQWATSTSATGPWNDIKDANSATYAPSADDVGFHLQATATYSDGHLEDDPYTYDVDESIDVARKAFDRVVLMSDYRNTVPKFDDEDEDDTNGAQARRSVAEDATAGTKVGEPVAAEDLDENRDQEVLTYALSGTGSGNFTIDGSVTDTRSDSIPGQIRVADGADLDFEDDTKNIFESIVVTATDPSQAESTATVTIRVTNVEEAPVISEMAETALTFEENAHVSNLQDGDLDITNGRYSAEDDEDTGTADLTWTVEGEDRSKFDIGNDATDRGQLSFKSAPDFEPAGNNDRNNIYQVTVKVTDTSGKFDTLPVTVTLENVEEPGSITLSNRQPEVGRSLRATLSDDDGAKSDLKFKWYRANSTASCNPNDASDDSLWTASTSTSANSATYQPVALDVEKCLRVVADYTDGKDNNKVPVREVTEFQVQDRDNDNEQPKFLDGEDNTISRAERWIDENAQAAAQIGTPTNEDGTGTINPAPVNATDEETDGQTTRTDNLTYSLGGTHANLFYIDPNRATGQIYVAEGTNIDYESRSSYTVNVIATDPSGSSRSLPVDIRVRDLDEDPSIVEDTEADKRVEYAEGRTDAAATFTATDDDDDDASPRLPLRWSITGADSSSFTTSSRIVSGRNQLTITFAESVDFEDPIGTKTDNDYVINITVTDSDSDDDEITGVTITVTNVDEDGEVTLDALQAKEGVPLKATLTDEDGPRTRDNADQTLPVAVTDLTDLEDPDDGSKKLTSWQWYRSTSRSGPWTEIMATTSPPDAANVTSDTHIYTPSDDDVGKYLRAVATYTDGQSENDDDTKTAEVITERPVRVKEYVNDYPRFRDADGNDLATTSRSVFENIEGGSAIGDPVVAKDPGVDGSDEALRYTLAGVDGGFFEIDGNGQITLKSDMKLDFENLMEDTGSNTPTIDGMGQAVVTAVSDDEILQVTVEAEDPSASSTTIVVLIEVKDAQDAPVLRGDTAADDPVSSVDRPERSSTHAEPDQQDPAFSAMIATYMATDDEDDGDVVDATYVKWSWSGPDMDDFELCDGDNDNACDATDMDTSAVDLRFEGEPDFEARSDANGDNTYSVTVTATDSYGAATSQDVSVTLTNVEETGAVTFTNRQPEVSVPITARLTDPDEGVTIVGWQWSTAEENVGLNAATGWTDILGATGATYTPGSSDDTKQLRAIATYRDAANVDNPFTHNKDESERTATDTTEFVVKSADANNQAPVFPDQDDQTTGDQSDRATRSILESARHPDEVGDPVSASLDRDGADNGDGDNLTYTLGGTDAALFSVDQDDSDTDDNEGGQIRVGEGTKFDYETKTSYTVTVTATDPSLASDTITVTINILDVDEAPEISKRGLAVSGSRSVSYEENDTADVASYRATGSDSAGASWSLEGADASAFAISSGVLAFRSSPNFESPSDQGADNTYEVTVKATSGSLTATRNVSVSVTNEDEDGTVNLTSPGNEVKVGVELTAELDERDEETNVTWQWASSSSNTGPWDDITGETNNTYTPVEGDVGNYLRVTASYTDATFGSDSEEAITADAVEAASTAGTPGTLALSPTTQLTSGDRVTATLTDADNPTNQAWRWARSSTASGTFTNIPNATSASYTTTDADAGNYLRATVTYDDNSGTDQTEDATTSSAVKLHRYDDNANGEIERDEVIDAINDYLFGSGTDRDEVIEVINLYLFG